MITQKDKQLITEAGKECLLEIVFDSKILKEKLTFKEHVSLASYVTSLKYEDIVTSRWL